MKCLQGSQMRLFFACVVCLFVAGCGESDGPAEQAGKALDQAIENTTDSVGDAMKSTGDAITETAEDATSAASDVMDSTGEALTDAAENAGSALKDAGEGASEAVGLKD
jgi:gas vesicle protein